MRQNQMFETKIAGHAKTPTTLKQIPILFHEIYLILANKIFSHKPQKTWFFSLSHNQSWQRSVLCALSTLVTAMSFTLDFLRHTDESCKDETRAFYNLKFWF